MIQSHLCRQIRFVDHFDQQDQRECSIISYKLIVHFEDKKENEFHSKSQYFLYIKKPFLRNAVERSLKQHYDTKYVCVDDLIKNKQTK